MARCCRDENITIGKRLLTKKQDSIKREITKRKNGVAPKIERMLEFCLVLFREWRKLVETLLRRID